MSTIVVDEIQASGGGNPLKLPMKDGTAGQSLTTDGAGQLKFATAGGAVAADGSAVAAAHPIGQAFYGTGSGWYSWTCPPDVTKVHVVCIGGGGSANGSTASGNGGGGGGGLGWKNNIAVTPGTVYPVHVGRGGDKGAYGNNNATDSFFGILATTFGVSGEGGQTSGGSYTGDGGGEGGNSGGSQPGGGTGGYTASGGNYNQPGDAGGGGGGGGRSYSSTYGYPSGGGVAPFGQGNTGPAGQNTGSGGQGGSGGEDGFSGENGQTNYGHNFRHGGLYGGGGGGPGDDTAFGKGLQCGARGCVRIIWGDNRSFPSTGCGDM
jgi:hypothetical protein